MIDEKNNQKEPEKAGIEWKCNKCGKIPDKNTVPKMLMNGKCVTCYLGGKKIENE